MVGSAGCRCGSAVQCSRRLLAGAIRRALGAMRLDEHLDVGPELREGDGAFGGEADECDTSDGTASVRTHDTCDTTTPHGSRKQSMLGVAWPGGNGKENGSNGLVGEETILTVICAWAASAILFDCDSSRQTSAKSSADAQADIIQQALGHFVVENARRRNMAVVGYDCNDGGVICSLLQLTLRFLGQLLRVRHESESDDSNNGLQVATVADATKERALLRAHHLLEAHLLVEDTSSSLAPNCF